MIQLLAWHVLFTVGWRPLTWHRWNVDSTLSSSFTSTREATVDLRQELNWGRLRPFNLSSFRRDSGYLVDWCGKSVRGWAGSGERRKSEKGSIIKSELTRIAPTVSILHHSIVLGDVSFSIHHCLSIYAFHFNFSFCSLLFFFTPVSSSSLLFYRPLSLGGTKCPRKNSI